MGIKTVPHRPYIPDLAPYDVWLFPKLRGCRYETMEEIKEAVTKVIDTLKQEGFHGAFQNSLLVNLFLNEFLKFICLIRLYGFMYSYQILIIVFYNRPSNQGH